MNITIGNPWAVSEKGGRLNNEDSIFPLPETANSNQNLFLVCDGVGGAEKGEIASSLACESFQTFFSTFREGACGGQSDLPFPERRNLVPD